MMMKEGVEDNGGDDIDDSDGDHDYDGDDRPHDNDKDDGDAVNGDYYDNDDAEYNQSFTLFDVEPSMEDTP